MKLFITKIPGFLAEALSENGTASIKRVTLIILLFAFLAQCAANMIWKWQLIEILNTQLFEALIVTIGTVFGANVLNGIKDIKIEQSKNNAAVGSPSPSPDTVIKT